MSDLVTTILFPSTNLLADISLLVLRVYTGVAFIQHGIPKLKNLGVWSGMIGMPQPVCAAAAITMVIGGILLIPGLLTTPAAAGIDVVPPSEPSAERGSYVPTHKPVTASCNQPRCGVVRQL